MNNSSSSDVVGLPGTQQLQSASAILRRTQAEAESGYSRSTIYLRITQGLFPKPVRLGSRAVGWPAREVAAINEARIGGASDAQLRDLVEKLLSARGAVPKGESERHRVVAREQAEAGEV
jgi:prophage regulatory protein